MLFTFKEHRQKHTQVTACIYFFKVVRKNILVNSNSNLEREIFHPKGVSTAILGSFCDGTIELQMSKKNLKTKYQAISKLIYNHN